MVERTGLRRDPLPVKRPVQPLIDRMAARLDKVLFGGGLEKLGAKMAFGGMVPANCAPFIPSIHFIEANNAQGAGAKPVDDLTAAQDRISVAMSKEQVLDFKLSEKMNTHGTLKFRTKKALLVSAGASLLTTFAGGIAISGLLPFGTSAAVIVGFPLVVYTGLALGVLRLAIAASNRKANKAVQAAQATLKEAQKEEVFAGTENPTVLEALARELASAAEPSRLRLVSAFAVIKPEVKGLGERVKTLVEEKERAAAEGAANQAQAKYDALPLPERIEQGSWQQLATLFVKIKADLAGQNNPWPTNKLELRFIKNRLEKRSLELEVVASMGQNDQIQSVVGQDIADLLPLVAGEIEK